MYMYKAVLVIILNKEADIELQSRQTWVSASDFQCQVPYYFLAIICKQPTEGPQAQQHTHIHLGNTLANKIQNINKQNLVWIKLENPKDSVSEELY